MSSATVGLPLAPSPLVTPMPAPAATLRLVKVSAAVSVTSPAVPLRPASAVRVASDACLPARAETRPVTLDWGRLGPWPSTPV
jgi:hypothetical protein